MLQKNPFDLYIDCCKINKYIFEPDLMEKLPGILSLMKDLMAKQTGLQYHETIFRYLSGTVDGITTEKFRESIQLALSKKEGDYIMTLAERLKEEGRIEGEIKGKIKGEIKGRREGLKDAVELGLTLKFPDHVDDVMNQINEIDDLEVLMQIKETLKIAEDISQILVCIKE